MCHKNNVKKGVLILSILLVGLFNQPTQAHASGSLILDGVLYLRYGDVYYRPAGHGYEVVRIEKPRERGGNYWHGGDSRDERR